MQSGPGQDDAAAAAAAAVPHVLLRTHSAATRATAQAAENSRIAGNSRNELMNNCLL